MQVDLSGLRALVTGSTKGIGFAIAQKLAASGAAVAVNGRKAADVEAALGRIRAAVSNATLVGAPGDAATASGVAAIIKAVARSIFSSTTSASSRLRTRSKFPTT